MTGKQTEELDGVLGMEKQKRIQNVAWTSIEAYAQLSGITIKGQYKNILQLLSESTGGLTLAEIAETLNMQTSTVSARLNELRGKSGMVYKSCPLVKWDGVRRSVMSHGKGPKANINVLVDLGTEQKSFEF